MYVFLGYFAMKKEGGIFEMQGYNGKYGKEVKPTVWHHINKF